MPSEPSPTDAGQTGAARWSPSRDDPEFPRIARPVSIFARSLLVSTATPAAADRLAAASASESVASATTTGTLSARARDTFRGEGSFVDHGYPFARGPQLFNNADTNTTQPNHDVVVAHGPCALGTEGRGNPPTDQ